MTILQINKFYYLKGGAERYLFELSDWLEASGVRVIPFAMAHPDNEPSVFSSYFPSHVSTEKVSLMTLHAAKGLEFPVVFIIGCEQNIIPLNLEGLTSDIEEERRLFYVGMTRAKERLFLIRAKRRRLYGKICTHAPSVFLSDIEEELKEYEQMTRQLKRPKKKEDQQLSLF